jgi:hypothetical protein
LRPFQVSSSIHAAELIGNAVLPSTALIPPARLGAVPLGRCRMPTPDSDPDTPPPSPRPATLRQVAGAVFWSFFGVRKGDAMRRDMVTIKPHQVIIVGILSAAVLVVVLLIVVRLITRNA